MGEETGAMMLTYTENLLGVELDGRSRRLLGRNYAKLNADEFVLGPPAGWQDEYLVRDCSFFNCVVNPGPLLVLGGVELRNVVFENMQANDAFTIRTESLLDRVTIRGTSKSANLWIKP